MLRILGLRPRPSVIFPCFNWFIALVSVVNYEGVSLKCNGNGMQPEQMV